MSAKTLLIVLALPLAAVRAAYHPGVHTGTPSPSNNANATVTATEVVTAYTTICTEPTTFVVNDQTYSAEGLTTITITDCPCTVVTTKEKPTPMPEPPHCDGSCHPDEDNTSNTDNAAPKLQTKPAAESKDASKPAGTGQYITPKPTYMASGAHGRDSNFGLVVAIGAAALGVAAW